MPIYKGSTKLGSVYHGGTKIGKVYKGDTLVYSGISPIEQYRSGSYKFTLTKPKKGSGYIDGYDVLAVISSISGTLGEEGSTITGISPNNGNFTAGYSTPPGSTAFNKQPSYVDGYLFYPYMYYHTSGSMTSGITLWVSPKQLVGDSVMEGDSSIFPVGYFTNVIENEDGTLRTTTYPENYWNQSWAWETYTREDKFPNFIYR